MMDLLKGYNMDSAKLVIHIVASASVKKSMWVPVSAKFIAELVPEAEKKRLEDDGVLEVKEHSYARGQSKEWRLGYEVARQFYGLQTSLPGAPLRDALTGRKLRPAVFSSTDQNKNRLPSLVLGARQALKYGYFNLVSLREYLSEAESSLTAAVDTQKGASIPPHRANFEDPDWLRARLDNDIMCYAAILRQKPELLTGSTYRYGLAYAVQKSGRISQVGGGAQSCSREMKQALYRDLEGLPPVFNYDLKSSQAYILRAMMTEAEIDTSWLDDYLASDKSLYADQVGISIPAWKSAFYSTVMGADLAPSLSFKKRNSAMADIFYDEFYAPGRLFDRLEAGIGKVEGLGGPETIRQAEEAYQRFREVVNPFHQQLRKWKEMLKATLVDHHGKPNRAGRSVTNAVGVHMSWTREVEESGSEKAALGKLAAFVLQGKEAAFIHRLTAALPEHQVMPISNEHDGLVTLGAIPAGLIDRVREQENMPYAELVEKNFV